LATVIAVAATLGYGQWRLRQTGQYLREGPRVASLQSNVPQSVKRSFSRSGQLFDDLMVQSKAALGTGAELIVWPETMVQGLLDPGLWPQLVGDLDDDKAFHNALCEHARGNAYLLVGALGGERMLDPSGKPYLGEYNSAYLYRPDGTQDPQRYDKIHLVLFGEYTPFRRSFPWLFQQLGRFLPEGYNVDYSLEHGKHYTIFEMNPQSAIRLVGRVRNPQSPRPPLLNSVKVYTMDKILPLKKEYDFSFIGLLVSEDKPTGPGGSHSVDELYGLAKRIFERAVGHYGFRPEQIYFDSTVFPLAIDMPMEPGVPGYTYRTFETIKKIRSDPAMKSVHCSLGVSNSVRDLPARKIGVCRAYVAKAMEYGLDAGIVNTSHQYGSVEPLPELMELVAAFAQMDGSTEKMTKAMDLMGQFCRKNRKST